MMPSVELVADIPCEVGENPLWHPRERCLYWCDIPRGRLYRHDPATKTTAMVRDGVRDGNAIGGFTIQQDDALLLFMNGGCVKRWSHDGETTVLAGIKREEKSRFNDVIANSLGQVFCGTMTYEKQPGRLYRFDPDGTLHTIIESVGCPNGMAFSRDGRCFFFTDSFAHSVYRFDYDQSTGHCSNQQLWLKTDAKDGYPDGITIDAEGCCWIAHWNGSCVTRYSLDACEILRVPVPTAKVASVTFGGEDLKTLFITTAGGEVRQKGANQLAGSLFKFHAPAAGVAEYRSGR